MARTDFLLSSVNSGEFSPHMESLVTFDRYPNAAKTLRNVILLPQGGFTRRPGTRFVKEVKTSADATILLPFKFSEDVSYTIETGEAYMRVFKRQGQVTVAETDGVITNGTFTSNITGWTDRSDGSASIAHDATNGRLQLVGALGDTASAEQAITIDAAYVGVEHVLKFKVDGYISGGIFLQIGSTSEGEEILDETALGIGYHSIGFTPDATTFYIQFQNRTNPSQDIYVDDVELLSDVPMEVETPYTSLCLCNLRFFQAADVVYLLHPDYAPHRLERRGDASWSVTEAFFEDGPWLDINDGRDYESENLFINPDFRRGLQGWITTGSAGDAFAVHNTAGNFAELDPNTGGVGNIARLRQSVVTQRPTTLHFLQYRTLSAPQVGLIAGPTAGSNTWLNSAVDPGWTSVSLTPTGSAPVTIWFEFFYNDADAGRAGISEARLFTIDTYLINNTVISGESPLGSTQHTFFPADVGRLVRFEYPGIEPGYNQIYSYTSKTNVDSFVIKESSTNGIPQWRLGAWGGNQGYPIAMGFFDGRSVFANTLKKPNTMWFSKSGDLQNMRPDTWSGVETTVEDDDAIDVTLDSKEINPIFWVSGEDVLLVGTAGGVWVVKSAGQVITPEDRSAKLNFNLPCGNIEAVQISQFTIFADKSRREINSIGYDFNQNKYIPTDLTVYAEHIFRSPVAQMVYQRRPFSTLWCRRDDGRLATLAINPQHEILGWAQQIIGGSFSGGAPVVESVAIIPGNSDAAQVLPSDERDEVWNIVKRTINGATKRYIEVHEKAFEGPLREDYDTEALWRAAVVAAQVDAFYVDSGLTYDGSPTTTITGLDHLEGETVKVLADGKIHPDKTVSSGSITLEFEASKVQVGLGYYHKYESLKLAIGAASGTSVGKQKRISSVRANVVDTAIFKVGTVDYAKQGRTEHTLRDIGFRTTGAAIGGATPLYTGESDDITVTGDYSTDTRLYMEGDTPLPCTVIGIVPSIETVDK